MSRLKDIYNSEIVPKLSKDFGYKCSMEIPKILKIVVNMGLGEAIQNVKILDSATAELNAITGQKSVITKAKNRLLPSSCARACRSAAWSPFVVTGCMNFLTVS